MKKAMRTRLAFLGVALATAVIALFATRGRGSVNTPSSSPSAASGDGEDLNTGRRASLAPPRLLAMAATPPDAAPPREIEESDVRMAEFQSRVTGLIDDCTRKGSCDSRQLLMDQVGLAFDLKLGPDHPMRKELQDVVGWSFDQREAISKRFTSKEIDRKKLFGLLNEHFAEMGNRYGQLLDDVEYETMFGSKKGRNPAEYFSLTDQVAENLDRHEASLASNGTLEPPPESEEHAESLISR